LATVGHVRYKLPVTPCRRLAALVAALVAAVLPAAATVAQGDAAPKPLHTALRQALAGPGLAPSRTSALAVDLSTGELVFQSNPGLALAPASAEKLAVSFAALRLLGPGFRFHTEVVGEGVLDGRVWRGDLYLVGYGDPTLSRRDLKALARDVAAWGIRRVTGRVIGDERHFDAKRAAPGWKASFLGLESPPLSALVVDAVDVRGANGSAAAAAHELGELLARRGIAVGGRPGSGRAPRTALPVALDVSEPLAAIVGRMNRDSDNFVAEMVLKELGASVGRRGSTAVGGRVVVSELRAAGVPVDGVRIADGSGLSRLDRLSAQSLVAILRAGADDPAIAGPFVTSLAVAGVSGTLERRLRTRPTRGRVLAKTGTTSASSALAGYVRKRYAFAIIQNGSPVPYWTARQAQDRFVTILARR
jgi:D-alanyl-D-alanine carboxypeptidase/D-alanyl-D-alanine-endopeptidase (penicillin-binding protein 4)